MSPVFSAGGWYGFDLGAGAAASTSLAAASISTINLDIGVWGRQSSTANFLDYFMVDYI